MSMMLGIKGTDSKNLAVYLHNEWDREYIEALLLFCKKAYGMRSPEDDFYGWARLCQVIGNCFTDDGAGVGIDIAGKFTVDTKVEIKNWSIAKVRGKDLHWMMKTAEDRRQKIRSTFETINIRQPLSCRAEPVTDEDLQKINVDEGSHLHRFPAPTDYLYAHLTKWNDPKSPKITVRVFSNKEEAYLWAERMMDEDTGCTCFVRDFYGNVVDK